MTHHSRITPPCKTWATTTAELIEAIGTERFSGALRNVLLLCCNFDSMIVFEHEGANPPIALYQDLDEIRAATSVDYYATGPYLLDPLYRACRDGVKAGAYRTTQLAPAAFYRSEYYKTFFRKLKIRDEIGLLIANGTESWFVVSLARSARAPEFEDEDTNRLNDLFDIIVTTVRLHWGQPSRTAAQPFDEDWEVAMKSFGAAVLSPREHEVMQLVLFGHSTQSAAAVLEIAEGTIKAHRHNAYSKLGISSQAELFSMATRHLAGRR